MAVIMTAHWTVSFRSARQVHVLFSSTGPRRGCAVCTHSHRNACTSKKVWKQTLPWPLGFYGDRPDRTGASRRIYTHIKRRGKRFHYSFVYGTPRLCTVQRLLREKSGCAVTKGRNVVRAPRAENGTLATRFSGTKRRGSRPIVTDKNSFLPCIKIWRLWLSIVHWYIDFYRWSFILKKKPIMDNIPQIIQCA